MINITEIAEALNGSCETLDQVLEDYGFDIDDLAQEQFEKIDVITLQCETCGWWCDAHEVEDSVCEDCRES